MQKTNFPIEILIHDDASTDGTTEIIREYEEKYPDLIAPIYEEVNQYQNGHISDIDFFNYRRARGKYIAYCEGDDYWTDSLKLQKQVDFLESHEDYSLCFTRNDIYNSFYSKMIKCPISCDSPFVEEVFAGDHLKGVLRVLPMTMVFRFSFFSYEWSKHYTHYCDTMEIYHLLKVGKGAVLNFVSGVYNSHPGGVSSSNPPQRRSLENLRDSLELYRYFGDEATTEFYKKSILWRLNVCKENGMQKEFIEAYKLALKKTPEIALKVLAIRIKMKIKAIIKNIK